MTPEEQKKREEELDRFWSMEHLLPAQKKLHPSFRDTDTTELVLEPPVREEQPPSPDRLVVPPKPERKVLPENPEFPPDEKKEEKEPTVAYVPEHSLIRSVRLRRCRTFPLRQESFVRDAERLFAAEGAPCERTTFFSYVPQYSQMNRAQLEWYLWWRHEFRQGTCIPTDYSYLVLYISEVLNFPEQILPTVGQRALCTLWKHYRDTFEQLDHSLPEWICDYSLIHQLPAPQLSPVCLRTAIKNGTLREFYVPVDEENGDIRALLWFCSSYDYRKSRFCTPENLPLFNRILPGALRAASTGTFDDGTPYDLGKVGGTRHVMRRSYEGILTLDSQRRFIDVEYRTYHCPTEWKALVTDILKYAENAIRASQGIRSRLAVRHLPANVREKLDFWLRQNLPAPPRESRTRKHEAEEEAAYAALYDLPQKAFSLQNAMQIESESWETTRRLVEAFEENGQPQKAPSNHPAAVPPAPEPACKNAPAPQKPNPQPPATEAEAVSASPVRDAFPTIPPDSKMTEPTGAPPSGNDAFSPYLPFLHAVAEQNPEKQRKSAADLNAMPDAVADRINELAAELYGDILLEEGENGYEVVADYSELFQSLLQ